ncbi:hypothetical protein RHGRI_007518 [Rhododendron griersonianum]|uniref:Reverse transcriptase n=1 Tax=Rhododendron griersonianum TaxID=479676 RepID=A0AAV6KYT8_9ERIC|nr:hypothetical protein RHGRI_007518 [Rhododendron griersonianum]
MELRYAEEAFVKQRSRIKWLALGDNNTRFFHQKVCAHRARNTILSLQNGEGLLLEDLVAIRSEILGYYEGLLGTPFSNRVDAKLQLQNAILSKVSDPQKAVLIAPVSEAEIKKALWSINGDKSPGPDGYNSLFFFRRTGKWWVLI